MNYHAKDLGLFSREKYNHSNDFIWQSSDDDGEAKKIFVLPLISMSWS